MLHTKTLSSFFKAIKAKQTYKSLYKKLLVEIKNAKTVIILFFVWRILLFIPTFVAQFFIPVQKDSVQYTLWAYTNPYFPVSSSLLFPLANFDGVHYLTIAGNSGYMVSADGRFFPFYPFLLEIAGFLFGRGAIFGGNQFLGAFFVTQLITLVALVMFYKLLILDYPRKIALTACILLLAFPTSFFLGSIYSEGIFLLLSFSIFYLLRKEKFGWAVILSICLCITRIVGLAIIPIVGYMIFQKDILALLHTKKIPHIAHLRKKILLLACIPLGLVLFCVYSYFYLGDALFFLHAQQHVVIGRSSGIVFFPQTLFRYVKILLTVPVQTFGWWIAFLEFLSFIFGAVLLWYAYVKKVDILYIIFGLLCFLIPTQTGTFSGLPRYVLISFPIFIALALSNKWIKIIYVVIGLVALFFLFAYFSRGYFVA